MQDTKLTLLEENCSGKNRKVVVEVFLLCIHQQREGGMEGLRFFEFFLIEIIKGPSKR
jgi:hypothetical protein